MYPIGHPAIASRIAKQQIDDRIRDAEARRLARAARRKARNVSDVRTGRQRATVPYPRIDAATSPTD